MRLVLVAALCAYTALAQEWPQFRGNAQLTGVGSGAPAIPKLLWTHEVGEPVESSAAIAGGSVYVGSQSGELIALDLASGKVRWKYKASEAIGESSPAVGGGVVYVGDLSGVLHAVSAADGKRLWTFKTGSEIKASPVITAGKVLIGSYDGHLYAVDAAKGSLAWRLVTDGPVHSTAAVAGGLAFIAGCDGILRAIRVDTGAEAYQVKIGSYTGASPAHDGQNVYFGTYDNEVLGVNLAKRQVLWRYEHPQRKFPFYSSAAVSGGSVILGGRDKFVHCLNAQTGKVVWTFTTRARVDSSPLVADGRVWVGSNDGRLYAIDLKTGAKVWEFNAGGGVSASPALAAGRIVVGTQDGKIYCFGS
jgi:outer membrane protein assembly factor BamB